MTSRLGYVIGLLCLLAGMSMAGWLAWSEVAALRNVMIRVVVPGSTELTLDETGTYTIFHESDSVVDGKLYSASNISGLSVTVTADNGQQIAVTVPNVSSSYSMGGHNGKSVLAFDIASAGRYRLSALYANGRTEPQTVLAISRGFVGRLVGTILGVVFSILAGFGSALALVLTTYFRRRRVLRMAAGMPSG